MTLICLQYSEYFQDIFICQVIPPNRVNTTEQLRNLRMAMANTTLTNTSNGVDAYLIYEGSYYGVGMYLLLLCTCML